MSKKIKIGIDIGKSAVKYCYEGGLGVTPSLLSTGMLNNISNRKTSSSGAIRVNGVDYIVGELATMGRGFSFAADEKKGTERSLILVLKVLSDLGAGEAEIMVGLPVSSFAFERDSLKKILTGEKKATINGQLLTFNITPRIMMEPIGTYFFVICDEAGYVDKSSPYFKRETAVIDIGWSTLDVVSIRSGILGEHRNSELLGASVLFEEVWKHLEMEHGMLRSDEKMEICRTITKQPGANLVVGGRYVNPAIWSKIDNWKRQLAQSIIQSVRSTLRDSRPPIVLFTGGGSILLRSQLKIEYPAFTLHDKAEYANAIGFYRSLLNLK